MKRKSITMVLVLALALSLCSLPVMADNSTAAPYPVYVSLGDSIPAGYGPYNYAVKGFARVDTAYPAIVADNAAEEFIPLGRTGFRTAELRYMLDHSYEGDDALFSLSKFTEDKEYYRNYFPESVARADLITVHLGSNDVLNYAFSYAKSAITDEKTLRKVENAINDTLAAGGDSMDALVKVVQLSEQLTETGAMGAAFVKGMMKGLAGFMQNWEAIMKSIYDLNPDAKVIAVGLYNPLKTTKLMSSSAVTIGKAFAVVIGQMNMFMQFQSAYHSRYTFVNVEDTEIYTVPPFTSDAFNTQMVGFVNPTEEGHRSIARKILGVLGLEDRTSRAKTAKPAPKYLNTENHKAFVSGYSDGTFRPQATATRAEVASMLCALLQDSYKNPNGDPGFRDISGHWGENQIRTIASLDLVSGYSDGTFRPDRAITRGEAAAILTKLFDDPAELQDVNFSDIKGHWSEPYVKKAVSLGLAAGYADGTFRPDSNITRAQLVTMIYAALDRDVDMASMYLFPDKVTFSDVKDTHTYYYVPVMEAANTHTYEFNADKECWTSVSNG